MEEALHMARRDKDLLGLEVVSIEDASLAGEVDGLIVDETSNRVAGLLVDLGLYEAKALAFADIVSMGEDAVTVESSAVVRPISQQPELEGIVEREVHVSESLAISDKGDILGTTGDYFIDTKSGEIRGIELLVEDDDGERTFVVAMSGVVRIGVDLVMFDADYRPKAVLSGDDL
jgi:uncharacterized protein YrrD